MKKTEEKALRFISGNNIFPAGSNVLCALSGGADSVMLLAFLIKFQKRLQISSIAAVHVNHKLRGKESDADEAFCLELCMRFGISCFIKRISVTAVAKKNGTSIEEAGRIARYQYFNYIARRHGFTRIATAHHANDQAETVMHQMIKGGGMRGLGGILPLHGNVTRPLLALLKSEITGWLKQSGECWREDASNAGIDFERNFIRNTLLSPITKRFGENSITAIAAFSGFAQYAATLADSIASELTAENNHLLPEKQITPLPPMLLVEVIRSACYKLYGFDPGARNASAAAELLCKQPGKLCDLGNNTHIARVSGGLAFTHKNREKIVFKKVLCGGKVKVGRYTFTFSETEMPKSLINKPGNIEYICSPKKLSSLTVRNPKPGDYFYPIGSGGKKKISDFLSAIKVPAYNRGNIILVYNGEECVWVGGLRLDDRYKVKPGKKYLYQLELRG